MQKTQNIFKIFFDSSECANSENNFFKFFLPLFEQEKSSKTVAVLAH